jgi:hypothetical protein
MEGCDGLGRCRLTVTGGVHFDAAGHEFEGTVSSLNRFIEHPNIKDII